MKTINLSNRMNKKGLYKTIEGVGIQAAQKEFIRVEVTNSIIEGTASKTKMLAQETLSKVGEIKDLGHTLAVASYAAESSRVGSTTVKASVGGSDPVIYFTEEGKFKNKLFKKVFKPAGTKTKKNHKYNTVFTEGYNMFSSVDFVLGVEYTIYLVDANVIQDFIDELSYMDLDVVVNVDDLKQIVLDLDPITRALQESSIDVTKKKECDFGLYIEDIIGSDVKALNAIIKNDGLLNNFEMCIKDPKTKYEAVTNVVLDNDQVAIDTNASKAQLAILKGTNEFINGLFKNYASTTNDDYVYATDMIVKHKQFVYFISEVLKSLINRIEGDGRLQAETLRAVRDSIYVEAKRQEVPVEDVIKCGIAAGFTNFYFSKKGTILNHQSNVDDFTKFATTSKLFDDIFIQEYTGEDVIAVPLTIDEVFEDLKIGTVVKIEDGFGYLDGEEVLTVMEEDLTGHATVGDGELLFHYDATETVDYDRTCLVVDSFFIRNEDNELVETKISEIKSIDLVKEHIKRMLNCQCIVQDGKLYAKNLNNNKGSKVLTFNSHMENVPEKARVTVRDIVMSQRGAILLVDNK